MFQQCFYVIHWEEHSKVKLLNRFTWEPWCFSSLKWSLLSLSSIVWIMKLSDGSQELSACRQPQRRAFSLCFSLCHSLLKKILVAFVVQKWNWGGGGDMRRVVEQGNREWERERGGERGWAVECVCWDSSVAKRKCSGSEGSCYASKWGVISGRWKCVGTEERHLGKGS